RSKSTAFRVTFPGRVTAARPAGVKGPARAITRRGITFRRVRRAAIISRSSWLRASVNFIHLSGHAPGRFPDAPVGGPVQGRRTLARTGGGFDLAVPDYRR